MILIRVWLALKILRIGRNVSFWLLPEAEGCKHETFDPASSGKDKPNG